MQNRYNLAQLENFRSHLLFKVAWTILLTLHLNVGIENVYLFVNKNKSEDSDRNRQGISFDISLDISIA